MLVLKLPLLPPWGCANWRSASSHSSSRAHHLLLQPPSIDRGIRPQDFPNFPILAFSFSSFFFEFCGFPCFLCVFALFSKDFKGSTERKNPCFSGGSSRFCQIKQG